MQGALDVLSTIGFGVGMSPQSFTLDFFFFLNLTFAGAVAVLLLLAVALLCAYELCAVYVTAGAKASQRYSPSGFFFGVSAIALAINMLFICRMVFNGTFLYCYLEMVICFCG